MTFLFPQYRNCKHSTEVEFALPTQPSMVWFSAFPMRSIDSSLLRESAKVNSWWNHLVRGKLVLQKVPTLAPWPGQSLKKLLTFTLIFQPSRMSTWCCWAASGSWWPSWRGSASQLWVWPSWSWPSSPSGPSCSGASPGSAETSPFTSHSWSNQA